MDSRAKQRLTGAVILAALFVLLVPELLTGPKSSTAPAASPEEEQGLRSYTIEIDGKSETSSPPQVAQPVPVAPTPTPAPDNDDVAAPQFAESAPARQPEQREAAADVPASSASVESRQTPAAIPAAPARAEPARPAASQTPPPAAKGSFVVQLGSFGSRDNADRLVRDMSAKGFKAFVAPIRSGGRDLYRVRVGPTPDRASAEALAADLKRVGQSGSIVPIS
jgi:DedD protein